MSAVTCNYCGRPAQLVTGAELHPGRPDLAAKNFHRCAPCGAHVGCHAAGARGKIDDGKQPLGMLANAELRQARRQAHAAFDRLWKADSPEDKRPRISRTKAYKELGRFMGLSPAQTHIANFDLAQCRQVMEFVPLALFSNSIEPLDARLRREEMHLLCSARPLNTARMDELLAQGAGLHLALRCSVSANWVPAVQALLDRGANPNDGKEFPLIVNAACNEETCRLLLEAGADPNAASPRDGRTALHETDSGAACLLLLQAGADPSLRDNTSLTPRQVAIERKRPEIAAVIDAFLARAAAQDLLASLSDVQTPPAVGASPC